MSQNGLGETGGVVSLMADQVVSFLAIARWSKEANDGSFGVLDAMNTRSKKTKTLISSWKQS
jgi:hypothetical protein